MQIGGFTDMQLIKGCINGDVKCQEMLYKQFFSYAMSVCIRYLPNKDEAIEAVNDSFLKVFQNLDKFDTSKNFKPWFSKILINTAIDNYRKNSKHKSVLTEEYISEITDEEQEDVKKLTADDIIKLFAKLPDIYRIVFNLYEIEGYSHEEISKFVGIAVSTSRSYLTRAKKILRVQYNNCFNTINSSYEKV